MESVPSITEMRPSEIKKITDIVEREKVLNRFQLVNEIFVVPLQRLVAEYEMRVNAKSNYFLLDLSEYSIQDRMRILERMLERYGYSREQMMKIVPHKVEEVEILAEAKKNGYVENSVLDNASRVIEARQYVNYSPDIKSL